MEAFENGPLWQQPQLSAASLSPLSSLTIMGTKGVDIRAVDTAVMEVVVDTAEGQRTQPAAAVMELVDTAEGRCT
jgi:hypothetical protein